MSEQQWKHKVEQKLIDLYNLKSKFIPIEKALKWKEKANAKEVNSPSDYDFRTQISLTVKLQKDADLASAIPEYDFIPLSDDAIKNSKIIPHIWDYWWIKTNTDKQISRTVSSSTTFWTWIVYEWIKQIVKKVKEPKVVEWENWIKLIDFEEKIKVVYSWIWSERIPFENFYINWNDIESSTEAIVVRYFDKDEYISEKEDDVRFTNIQLVKQSWEYYPFDGWSSTKAWTDIKDWANRQDIVCEIEYWNCAKDEYIILANWVEVWNTPIPYKHKELPFSLYIDNLWEDRIWWIWEFELLEQDERYKNELRTLYIRWIKSAIGVIIKDKLNDIEEDEVEFGIWEIIEASDIEWIKQFAPNVPISAIWEAEMRVDNDIIAKSWVDFKALYLSPSESATKTESKNITSKKRVNKNIKDNAYDFFRRLWKLRISNIAFFHSNYEENIPISWWSIDSNKIFIPEWSGNYWSAKITKDMVSWDFDLIPLVDTMTANNKQKRRNDVLQYAQVVAPFVWEDGKPVIKWDEMVKLITEEFDYDFDKLTQQNVTSQSAKSILDWIDQQDQWMSTNPKHPSSPDFIQPDQRSWVQQNIPKLSWQASQPADLTM